jgi:hypothetical protein
MVDMTPSILPRCTIVAACSIDGRSTISNSYVSLATALTGIAAWTTMPPPSEASSAPDRSG